MKKYLSIFLKSNNSFEGIENEERVVYLLRRHIFVIFIHLIFLVLPAFIPIIIGAVISTSLQSYSAITLFLLLCSIFYCVLWFMAFYVLTMYTLDVWIVTNKRIIDSNQDGLFRRIISELLLSNVQDISVKTRGFFQTILKFGDVEIQTAGTENKFRFLQIPNPEGVKDAIMSQVSSGNVSTPSENQSQEGLT